MTGRNGRGSALQIVQSLLSFCCWQLPLPRYLSSIPHQCCSQRYKSVGDSTSIMKYCIVYCHFKTHYLSHHPVPQTLSWQAEMPPQASSMSPLLLLIPHFLAIRELWKPPNTTAFFTSHLFAAFHFPGVLSSLPSQWSLANEHPLSRIF